MDNEAGYAEAYKDVVHEDAVRVGGITKAPDYSFRIGGQRKFFVEAKKPAVDMKKDPEPYYQLRRYAFSAKLPLSILTDFEELAIVDCRAKPSPSDKASKGRIRYWRYEEYLDNFDEIYDTFSKEAVLTGSFDRFISSAKKKRGTGEVDKEFLKEIEDWRSLLARNIALRNPKLTQRELNTAVQLTIDRIIFLRICEDRGIEEYGVLHGLLNGKNVYGRLMELFRRADERYNSGLFHFQKEKGRPENYDDLTPGLVIDDRVLKDILKRLYYPDCPYEFSVLPADILGQVYEQFLGKVIRLTAGHRAVVEDKPEVKKAGGVYYTPTYIVDYIVKNTVGKLLEKSTPTKAAKLRILDPACGSGSFLIGAFQYLMDWHRDWYHENEPAKWARGKSPRLFMGKDGWQLTTAEKKRILLNNIHGVDIDPAAVEVTKLSLLLKVLEGESAETLGKNLKLFHERALPDLGNNIKCGNSLIGSDFYEGQQMGLMDEEERLRINAFDWDVEFPEVFSGKNPGFDAVIGNPPYVRQESLGDLKVYFQAHYKTYHGIADLYTYFIESAVSLLSDGGQFAYIVANKWMRANYGEPLRQWLKQQRIEEIIDFGDLPVFASATTYPCILRLSRSTAKRKSNASTFPCVKVQTLDGLNLMEYSSSNAYPVSYTGLDDKGWSLVDKKTQALLDKIKARGVPLDEYVDGRIYYGIKTGLNEAFVIDRETRERLIAEDSKSAEIIKPFLAGRDIKRYQPLHSDRFLIFTRHGININDYPVILRHLQEYRTSLNPRPKDWKGKKWPGRKPGKYEWYEIQDTIDYHEEFEKPKLLWPEIASSARFTLDDDSFYANNKVFLVPEGSLYLLGLLNSSLLKLCIHSVCTDLQGNSYNFSGVF